MTTKKRADPKTLKGEEFQIKHLVETTDISPLQAKELIRRHGGDWDRIRKEAELFKAES